MKAKLWLMPFVYSSCFVILFYAVCALCIVHCAVWIYVNKSARKGRAVRYCRSLKKVCQQCMLDNSTENGKHDIINVLVKRTQFFLWYKSYEMPARITNFNIHLNIWSSNPADLLTSWAKTTASVSVRRKAGSIEFAWNVRGLVWAIHNPFILTSTAYSQLPQNPACPPTW